MVKPQKVIKKIVGTATREREYFMVIATEAKKIYEIANSRINPKKIGKLMYPHLRRIQSKENWEQMRASVSKLMGRAGRLLKHPKLPDHIRNQLTDALEKLKIYEAGVLKDTVKGLAEKIKKEHGMLIVQDLPGIRKDANEIHEFATAAVYVDEQVVGIFRPK